MFRNDPVDSVKVSSTFDSIPAIQRFLQAEIERLLRDLMREEVPAIIHKLSLDWAMRNQADECLSPASLTNTETNAPLQLQSYLYPIDIDSNDPLRPIFSAENIHRLRELSLAQHTLSPFTPSIPQSVFRSSTSLIASSRYGAFRRRDTSATKLSEASEPVYSHAFITSPTESIHSAQSNDPNHRPTLYNRRQRSSYLRRSHPPKRKVVRLRPSNSHNMGDSVSLGSSVSEQGDYFSEPGGYLVPGHTIPELGSKGKKEHYEKPWLSNSFSQSWNDLPDEKKKLGDQVWSGPKL